MTRKEESRLRAETEEEQPPSGSEARQRQHSPGSVERHLLVSPSSTARDQKNTRAMVGTLAPHNNATQTIWSERGGPKRWRRRRPSAGKSAPTFHSAKSGRPRAPKRRLTRQQPKRRRLGTKHVRLLRRDRQRPCRGRRAMTTSTLGQTAWGLGLLSRQCDVHGFYATSGAFPRI